MRHGLFTLALAAALAACSKPNPLFLDTWEGISEGSSQIDTSATTVDATVTASSGSSVDPTSTTTIDETTTADATATSSPPTGTTGSTGHACVSQEIDVPPLRDTFVVESTDAGMGCTLDGVNGEVFPAGKCRYLEFGGAPRLSLFKGTDIDDSDRFSAYLLDFPRDDSGQVLDDGEAIPVEALESVSLRLAYSDPGGYGYKAAVVDLYVFPTDFQGVKGEWLEGSGVGDLCSEGSNFDCAQCEPGNPPTCSQKWFGLPAFTVPPAMFKLASVELPITGKDGDTALVELDPALFGSKPNNGFMVVMQGLVDGMQILTDNQPGPLRMHAKEFEDPNFRPALVVKACL
jgi:hypothetical protein